MSDKLSIKVKKTLASRLAETDLSNLVFGRTFSDHMFSADFIDGKWQDFQIVPFNAIQLSPAISALQYGQTFFEGVKAYKLDNGQISIFRPDRNALRFNRSAERLCMPPLPDGYFIQALEALVKIDRDWIPHKPHHSMYLRPFMFGSDEFLGVYSSKSYKFMILACPVGPYFTNPLIRVKIETHYTRAAEGGFGFTKAAGNYGGALLAAKLAAEEGYDQVVWTDAKEHKYIEEMGSTNAMFLLDHVLITPTLEQGTILEGVTRNTVITLAKELGYKVEERLVSVEEILQGIENGKLQDAFGAGTAATIAPISSISYNGREYLLKDPKEREFSHKILKLIDDIRYGHIADTHGWNHIVL